MKIFISWSGNRSKKVAEVLKVWLKCVVQATEPWISSQDIDRGVLWGTKIADALRQTKFGIICLTQENKNSPWILFESGAISKGAYNIHVCTLLIDLTPTDVENPLAQFNHTLAGQKESMWKLIKTVNNALQKNAIEEQILIQIFDTYWPKFETELKKILTENASIIQPKRKDEDILAEVLSTLRSVSKQMSYLRNNDYSIMELRKMLEEKEHVMQDIDEDYAREQELDALTRQLEQIEYEQQLQEEEHEKQMQEKYEMQIRTSSEEECN